MNTIYKATNKITGKSYIGFDSAWPSRKHRHQEKKTKQAQQFSIGLQICTQCHTDTKICIQCQIQKSTHKYARKI